MKILSYPFFVLKSKQNENEVKQGEFLGNC